MFGGNKKYDAIAIGVSAGGLQALTRLFEKLPIDYPIPVVVVQHRAKDQKYLLEEVLQQKCRITIKQADEKEKMHGGFVYIAPPDYHLLIEDDRTFSLSSDEYVSYSRPSINVLFESAAEVYKNKLIGIILTGANDDGARGIFTIRKYGGLTIAQNPNEALYPYMPQAAIKTGCVECIWNIEEIVKFLLKLPEYEKV
jgi:two-component system, chemotaxis family, protein-glutamate methylesterase/glutaminase